MLNSWQVDLSGRRPVCCNLRTILDETVRLAEAVSKRDIPVYCLTDTEKCPIADFASELLISREDEVGGFRALGASVTLTTALAVAVKALR